MVMDTKGRNTHYKWQLVGPLSRGSACDLLIRGDHLLLFDTSLSPVQADSVYFSTDDPQFAVRAASVPRAVCCDVGVTPGLVCPWNTQG